MPRRTWDANTKATIVLAGLQGRSVAELGHEYQIRQSPDDHWREQFLAQAGDALEIPPHNRKEARLARENARLTALVGELP